MSNEIAKKGWDFWVLVGLMLGLMGFMFSMNARINNMSMNMATKADIERVEADLKEDIARIETDLKADIARIETNITEIRTLLIDHLKDGHNHRKQSRRPAATKND